MASGGIAVRKIAYIEDDADARELFSAKFKADGVECDCYGSAEEAAPNVRPGAYDLLICDIRLPGISGVEFLSSLRRNSVFTPCVLITAFGNLSLTKQALNASANYLLEKPFAYADLKRVIEKVLLFPSSLQDCVDRGLQRLSLTGREQEIARLLLKGLSNSEMARVLELSEKTVKQYVSQIFQKSAVASRAEFFSYIFPY